MRLNNKFFFGLVIATALTCGCSKVDDFLGQEPSKNTNKTLETVDQLDNVLSSYTLYLVEQPDMVLASDDFGCSPKTHGIKSSGYFAPGQLIHTLWNDENTIDNRYYTWMKEYPKIYYANLVLDNINKVSGDQSIKDELIAEAHFLRAYSMFTLALAHTLYYDGKNGDELGLTLKSSTSFEQSAARASLADTWAFIEEDVQAALKITRPFKNTEGRNQNWRGNTVSVKAFAARYYLYRGDYEKAMQYASDVLKEYSAMKDFNDPSEMYYHRYTDTYTVDGETITCRYSYIFEQLYSASSYINLFEWKELLFARTISYGYYWYAPSDELIANYSKDLGSDDPNDDLRYRYFMVQNNALYYGDAHEYAKLPGYCQFYYSDIISGPTTAEMNLIMAECYARSSNISQALTYLEKVRKCRIAKEVYAPCTAGSADEALKVILRERRREMPFSIRWYDLKRLNANDPANQVTVKKTFYEYNNTTVLKDKGTKEYTLEPNSRKYARPIYSGEIANSDNVIQQNTY